MALGGKLPGAFRVHMASDSVTTHLNARSRNVGPVVRIDRQSFAAKVRLVRAVLGWSQTELGRHVGLTQRAIHKLEQGETEPRRSTVQALEDIWRDQSIEFEDLPEGGFRVRICPSVLDAPLPTKPRRTRS
jgi:DNA-binding XRE family transcriptional regulator